MEIVEFLRARLDEDEREAKVCLDRWIEGHGTRRRWERQLREVEAMRRIVDLHANWPVLVQGRPKYEMQQVGASDPGSLSFRATQQIAWLTEREYRERFGVEPPAAPMIRALASVYVDHPHYDPAWADD